MQKRVSAVKIYNNMMKLPRLLGGTVIVVCMFYAALHAHRIHPDPPLSPLCSDLKSFLKFIRVPSAIVLLYSMVLTTISKLLSYHGLYLIITSYSI